MRLRVLRASAEPEEFAPRAKSPLCTYRGSWLG